MQLSQQDERKLMQELTADADRFSAWWGKQHLCGTQHSGYLQLMSLQKLHKAAPVMQGRAHIKAAMLSVPNCAANPLPAVDPCLRAT